jgi:LuxR family quorum-sensing system transcriptional regulator CciR
MPFGSFVEATNEARSPEEVFGLLQAALRDFGLDMVAFGALTTPYTPNPDTKLPAPAVALNYPQEWVSRYFEQSYEQIDPVVLLSPRTTRPIIWDNCLKQPDATPLQKQMFTECREAGLLDGLSIPIHGPMGGAYVLSLASSHGKTDAERLIPILRSYALQFFVAYNEAAMPSLAAVTLNDRERDCLLWSARGKTNWDIGVILNISQHTVDFHFRKAMTKLGSSNRIVAVVTAIRLGLIFP